MGLITGTIQKMRSGAQTETVFLSSAPRVLLFPLTLILQLVASGLGAAGYVLGSPPSLMVSGTLLWLVWFAGLFCIGYSPADRVVAKMSRVLRTAAIAVFALLLVTGIAELSFLVFGWADRIEGSSKLVDAFHHTFAYNDATALSDQATRNFLNGENPYDHANIITALQVIGATSDKVTPKREGSFADVFPYPTPAQLDTIWQRAQADTAHPPPELETRMNYPAGSFELPAPFFKMGIKDLRWTYLIYILLAIPVAIWLAPPKLRWALAGALVISLTFWNSIGSGETGSLAFPFMLLGWVLARRHPWYSALFMGVAVAVKQTAWFLVPFYLILLFQTVGFKKTLLACVTVTGVFVAANMPFMARDPAVWISSMGAPMSEDFFPLGGGIVTFVTSGLVPVRSPAMFTLLQGTVFGAGLAWYFANCRKCPHVGPVLAFFPLFFAWRSLWSYFFYIDVIVLAAVMIDEYGPRLAASKQLLKSAAG